MAPRVEMAMEMYVVIRYGLIIRGYLPISTQFGYLFAFVVSVSIMEDYLPAEDHILLPQFKLKIVNFVILSPAKVDQEILLTLEG